MPKQSIFNQATEKQIKTLKQYVPVVSRVHGGSHPEFLDVHKVFDTITLKTNEAGADKPELDEEFAKLRQITNNYTVPGDVCESYEAVYVMLAEIDKAYYA